MLEAVLTALETSGPASYLRDSQHAYPLVNAAHILALASLFGSILALDLRLLGVFHAIPVEPLARALPKVAAGGLAMTIATGVALFSVQPFDYLAHPVFPVKLALIALASANALLVHRTAAWRAMLAGGPVTAPLRLTAGLSLIAWSGAILAGRLLAF